MTNITESHTNINYSNQERTPIHENNNNPVRENNNPKMSDKQNTKEKFNLSVYSPITQSEFLYNDTFHKNVAGAFANIMELSPFKEPADYGKYSLRSFLLNPELTQTLLVPHMENNKSDSDSLAALLVRNTRFKLKFVTVYLLHQSSNNPNLAIAAKLEFITKQLQTNRVLLDFKKIPSNGPAITFKSTLHLLSKILLNIETQLKMLLPGLHAAHNLPFSQVPSVFQEPSLAASLQAIAPVGFVGLEGDYYYICRLLMVPHRYPGFSEDQHKQYFIYYQEFSNIFHFYLKPGIHFDFSTFIQNQNTINLPFAKFITQTSLSKNTFSRLVNAMNTFMLQVWGQVLLTYTLYYASYNHSANNNMESFSK